MADEAAPVVVCIDATSLAVLQLSREGASRWAWPDSSPLRPPGKPRPARNAALDRSRRELEAEAAAEFAEAGGGTSAASLAWRQVFVRRRLALVVSGALWVSDWRRALLFQEAFDLSADALSAWRAEQGIDCATRECYPPPLAPTLALKESFQQIHGFGASGGGRAAN